MVLFFSLKRLIEVLNLVASINVFLHTDQYVLKNENVKSKI